MKFLSKEWIDYPEEDGVAFEITPLNALQFTEAMVALRTDSPGAMMLVLKGVTGWRGVENDGKALPFNQEQLPNLGIDVCDWLFQRVLEKSRITKDEEKN